MWRMRRHRSIVSACGLLLLCIATCANATDLAPLRAQFELPPGDIDYAVAKLVVDRLVDPTTGADAVRREVDAWERAVRGNIDAHASTRQVLDALLRTLYEPGPWNQHRPFAYDLTDPFGRNAANKRLATYLAARKGNCVSMPLLVLIVGQRLGLPVALATAPQHVLVKFADAETDTWWNIEATAGGFKFDSSVERDTGITQRAIDNRLYLRPLSPREGLGVIASTLMEHFASRKDGESLMDVADLALSANPNDPVAMVWKANAYNLLLQARFTSRYPTPGDIPPGQRDDYLRLSRENLAWFEKAESLGWVETTPEQDAAYLQSLQRVGQ